MAVLQRRPVDLSDGRGCGGREGKTPELPVPVAAPGLLQDRRELTQGREEELTLEVKGRSVHLPRYWAGMARCTFWELCGQPLGPADYLALVGAVKLLVIEGIPELDSSKFNEAKRFVTLIDALYEGHVRLICSAEAEPEKLYLEGAGSFEFERTASRLREMQGADWGTGRVA